MTTCYHCDNVWFKFVRLLLCKPQNDLIEVLPSEAKGHKARGRLALRQTLKSLQKEAFLGPLNGLMDTLQMPSWERLLKR